jgi:hypothetical protein
MFAIFLSGCSRVTIPSPDVNQEEEIKEVVNGYWSALSNRQYSLAKNYCMPYGNFYNAVEGYQSIPYFESTTMTWITYINWVNITGNNATVNANITLNVTVCFGDICATESETLSNTSINLTKTSGNWKLE